MAVKGKNARLLVNQYDFSGVSNSLEVALAVESEDATVFTSTGKEMIAVNTSGTITQNGYFEDVTAGSFEASMQSALANNTPLFVAALFGTDTDPCPGYVARLTDISGLTIASPANGLITVQGEWTQGNGILRGYRLFNGSVTATGVTSPVIDLGTTGSAGGRAWLFVQSITGSATNADVRIIGSTSFSNWGTTTTEGTFTFSAVGGHEISLSPTIERYLRLNVVSLGGATGLQFTCIAAVSGVTY